MKTLDCTGCTHCCDWVTFTVSRTGISDYMQNQMIDYYRKRGFTLRVTEMAIHVSIYTPCPHKMCAICTLHYTTTKPAICRKYDCREDPHLPPGGNYEKGKDRP